MTKFRNVFKLELQAPVQQHNNSRIFSILISGVPILRGLHLKNVY